MDSSAGTCGACDTDGCKTCSPVATCSACKSTHYITTEKACTVCDTSKLCLTCIESNIKCTSCSDTDPDTDLSTYDSTNNVCHTGCKVRSNKTTCTECTSKYLSSGHCITLPSGATTATYDHSTLGSPNTATACKAYDAVVAPHNAWVLVSGVC